MISEMFPDNHNKPMATATNVPPKVRKSSVTPDYLRSETSFSRTCNIPNSILYIYRMAFS